MLPHIKLIQTALKNHATFNDPDIRKCVDNSLIALGTNLPSLGYEPSDDVEEMTEKLRATIVRYEHDHASEMELRKKYQEEEEEEKLRRS